MSSSGRFRRWYWFIRHLIDRYLRDEEETDPGGVTTAKSEPLKSHDRGRGRRRPEGRGVSGEFKTGSMKTGGFAGEE